MRKKIIYLLLMVVMTIVLAACGDSMSQSGDQIKILYSYSVEVGNTFRDTLAESVLAHAESVGVQVDIVHPNSIEDQVKQFKEAKIGGYDAIMCIPEDESTARELMAVAEGLPIVFMNKSPDEDVLIKDQYIYVASNEQIAGEYQANYILEKLSSLNEINVVILKGSRGHSAMKGRTESIKRVFRESGKNINIVFEDYGEWDTETSRRVFNVFLTTGKRVDAVLCNNDAIALGVVQSFKENGLDTNAIPILGVDATKDGCMAIKDGDMQFTVYQSASGQGEYAAKAAIELAKGRSIEQIEYVAEDGKHIWVPFEQVTKSNVEQYIK